MKIDGVDLFNVAEILQMFILDDISTFFSCFYCNQSLLKMSVHVTKYIASFRSNYLYLPNCDLLNVRYFHFSTMINVNFKGKIKVHIFPRFSVNLKSINMILSCINDSNYMYPCVITPRQCFLIVFSLFPAGKNKVNICTDFGK